jgi:hypothetical protein
VSDDRLDGMDEAQRDLALKLRTVLRESERVDAPTAARLAQARARAVDAGGVRAPRRWLWASGGLTAAAIIAALLVLEPGGLHRSRGQPAGEVTAVEALDVLTDDLDADFYEDLDMYRWLADDGRA